jgi:general secretion pathway protein G
MRKNRQNREPQRSGFTLLEVMVVLIILVTLASLSVVAVQGQLAKARTRAARTYVKMLENAVDQYVLDMGRPPTNEQGLGALVHAPSGLPNSDDWGGPYLKDTATSRDPWGNEYQYASPGPRSSREFEIWSYGPDMTDGTDDDIASWKSGN